MFVLFFWFLRLFVIYYFRSIYLLFGYWFHIIRHNHVLLEFSVDYSKFQLYKIGVYRMYNILFTIEN